MGSGQTFFKVIWSSEKMQIPVAFVSQMQGSLAKRCVLKDRHEKSWPVEVAREGDGDWYFSKGWTIFYREKSLEQGDILFFEYRGDNLFDFTLFGSNAFEKDEGARVKEEEDTEENDDDDNDYVQEEGDGDDDHDDDGDYAHVSKKIKPQPQATTTFGAETIPSKRSYKKQNVPDCYGAEIFKSGLASRPENPYFVTRSRTTRKNELYIPKDVIVDYHLNIPERLFLVDEQGRKWETKVKQWKDGRLWCTRGWRSLCNVNNIDMDDTCVCEFVQEQGCKDMCIRVRVVSADN